MRTVLYPWRTFEGPVDFLLQVYVDEQPLPVRFVDRHRRRVDLTAPEVSTWSRLRLRVEDAGPASEESLSGVGAHALVDCVRAAQRIPFPLTRTGSGWAGDVVLHRSEVVATAALSVTFTVDEPTVQGEGLSRVVGRSDAWTIAFEHLAGPPGHGRSPLDVVWVDFADPSCGPVEQLRRTRSALSYCDQSAGEPVLYLNTGVRGLQPLLDDPQSRGARRDAQNYFGSRIALDTVLVLVEAAIQEMVEIARAEDDTADVEAQLPQVPSLRLALEHVVEAGDAFEDVADLAVQVSRAVSSDDPDTLRAVRASLRASAQMAVGTRRAVESLIKAVTDD